jgi:hypothetical protein
VFQDLRIGVGRRRLEQWAEVGVGSDLVGLDERQRPRVQLGARNVSSNPGDRDELGQRALKRRRIGAGRVG